VEVAGGAIARLTTYITGELFAALRAGGTLAPLMAEGGDDTEALRAGANRAQSADALSHTLFEARARVVSGVAPAGGTRSYVSGLLIGTEFAGRRSEAPVLRLIASHALSAPYRDVAELLGYTVQLIDPDQAYLAALGRFMEAI
jgi:2-dehydro-3-deoxygalactonokinase